MEAIKKENIVNALRIYCERYDSQNRAANSLKNVSSATISQMLNGNWELIKDEMWRNVAAQIGYKEERWEAVETDGYKRLNHYLEDAKNNSLVMIWQLSRNVVNDIYNLMKDCKDYGFKDQIQRAAISIMNNIAEGFDSGSDKKFISYLNTTKKTIRHSHFQSRTI